MAKESEAPGKSLQRGFAVLRALAEAGGEGAKLIRVAEATGLTQATVHRLLQALQAEGMVEQDGRSRLYRLGIEFFALAARAGNPGNLRDLCRPVLQRLSAMLGDTVFLLVRSGFDALCLDRCEGPFPIRSFTGDIGGRVPLGVGQGALVILAFLPEAEREEVIRFNVPRLIGQSFMMDEVYLRTEMAKVRDTGFAARRDFVFPGMGGVAVPILDRDGRAVAALSIGTISERLGEDRLPTVVEILKREAAAIGPRLNPFDPALRRPAQLLGSASRGG
ncbi:IclR family transcriptional regulator [Inquilinus limosus]|uniref:IclR family transcriptional regulator n=1 Tax=Inquilinus limosus TaxID=171674 RepID=UPI000559864C|nr:IclR family transcriptional regulator [Inquilinus limosus]